MSGNYMDDDNASDGFRDVPEEAGGGETNVIAEAAQPTVVPTRRVLPTQATVQLPVEPIYEGEAEAEEQEEDYTEILSDASLRLEQGNLYKMVMNSDLFSGSGYDPKAIKNVEREIRNFAKERMEIMLGMRQEATKDSFPAAGFPFNALEVEVLKSLASAATKGASQDAEAFTPTVAPVPRRNTVNAITVRGAQPQPKPAVKATARPLQKGPSAPVKRPTVSDAVQRILDETGVTLEEINQTFDPNKKPLTAEELNSLTAEQIIERNRQIAQRAGKSVPSQSAMPMPSQEHIDAIYTRRANEATAHPQMQMIMNLLDKKK